MAAILCLGNFVVDIIGKPIDRLPPRGQLHRIETLETHVGGNGPNCAVALAKLGMKVAAAGRVGEDLYGRFLLERLAGEGVDVGLVARDPQLPTGVTLVMVDGGGERSFIYYRGANARFGPDDVDLERLPGLRHLHAGSHFVLPAMDGAPLAGLLQAARERGITTSLDVCWDERGAWMETLAPCLPHVDYFLPSEAEAAALSGEASPPAMAAAFHARGARVVVIKCADRGCFASAAGEQWWTPAFPVTARDSTGAGDAFVAGLLAGLLGDAEGEPSLRAALPLANACGALAVSEVGATTGLRPLPEVKAWAHSHGGAEV